MGRRVVGHTMDERLDLQLGINNQMCNVRLRDVFCSFDEFANVTSVRGGLCVYNYDL